MKKCRILILLLAVLLLLGCSWVKNLMGALASPGPADPAKALLGMWKLKAVESDDESLSGEIALANVMIAADQFGVRYFFRSDGMGVALWTSDGDQTSDPFSYTIDGNTLTLGEETMTFAIEGEQLILESQGLRMILEREPDGPEPYDDLNPVAGTGSFGNSKVFTGDGYQITLTDRIAETKSELGFDGYYTSDFGAVMIKIEPFTLEEGLAEKTIGEYVDAVIRNNQVDTQAEERDGFVFYRYRRDGLCGWNYAFKGTDAFYLVQFLCLETDESALTDVYFDFARSMTVN